MSVLVPKVFHRIWLGGKPMPEPFAGWGRSWLDYHPGWTMVEWTERNLPSREAMASECSWFYRQLDRCPNLSQRSDMWRYWLLREHGGVYLDTDFECRANVEDLVDGAHGFAAWQYDDQGELGAIATGFLGSTCRHPLLKDVFTSLEHADTSVFRTISPPFFTSFARRYAASGSFRVLPKRLFYPYLYTELERHREYFPDARAVHHWAGKWYAPAFAGAGGAEEVRSPEVTACVLVMDQLEQDLRERASRAPMNVPSDKDWARGVAHAADFVRDRARVVRGER